MTSPNLDHQAFVISCPQCVQALFCSVNFSLVFSPFLELKIWSSNWVHFQISSKSGHIHTQSHIIKEPWKQQILQMRSKGQLGRFLAYAWIETLRFQHEGFLPWIIWDSSFSGGTVAGRISLLHTTTKMFENTMHGSESKQIKITNCLQFVEPSYDNICTTCHQSPCRILLLQHMTKMQRYLI